jgi:hypothetical protein
LDPALAGHRSLVLEAAKDAGYPSSVERLRSFDPVRLHFAHDPDVWEH